MVTAIVDYAMTCDMPLHENLPLNRSIIIQMDIFTCFASIR